jgi:hypothetical protein
VRAQQACELGLLVRRLDWGYQAVTRFMCGQYQRCIEAAEFADDVIYNIPAWRAAALAHLGQLDEARQVLDEFFDVVRRDWKADTPCDDNLITRWLLHGFPIRNQHDWERLRDGLALAGAPHISALDTDVGE